MIQQINYLNLGQEIGLKLKMDHEERIMSVTKLNLKTSIVR